MVFTRNLNFEAAEKRHQLSEIKFEKGEKLKSLHGETLRADVEEATALGLSGIFMRVGNDFVFSQAQSDELMSECEQNKKYYKDRVHWDEQRRERVRKVRYFICALALAGMSLAMMSRLMLNVSVVGMVRKAAPVSAAPVSAAHDPDQETFKHIDGSNSLDRTSAESASGRDQDEQLLGGATSTSAPREEPPNQGGALETDDSDQEIPYVSEDGLTFNWSTRQVNLLLGSIFLGVPFGVLIMGDLVERVGAKWPMLAAMAFTALVNILTPSIARASFPLLIASRASLGFVQGALLPAQYELFNRWLTSSEAAIFAPMIKVSGPIGALIGVLLPGLMAAYRIPWPLMFMVGAFCCALWSAVWVYFATSTPQTNRLVEASELHKITRKKQQQQLISVATTTGEPGKPRAPRQASKGPTPWRQIIACPSVWALMLVKLTYLSGMDFVYIILPNYLSAMFAANTETISLIFALCFLFQLILLSPFSWLAQAIVARRAFGLSVTKWRKIFQGVTNCGMAALYALLALVEPQIELLTVIVVLISIFWMLGVGGESMVPYDLSTKYPASIVAFTHSISVSSGIIVSLVCNFVVGDSAADAANWRNFFLLLASAQSLGALLFCLILKAKPFLPEERVTLNSKLNASANGCNKH